MLLILYNDIIEAIKKLNVYFSKGHLWVTICSIDCIFKSFELGLTLVFRII